MDHRRVNNIDRDLLEAEREAKEEISPNRSSEEDEVLAIAATTPNLSGSTTRTRTRQPSVPLGEVELNRIFTYRLQHRSTVGSSRPLPPREHWLPLGAGKPYPPSLPAAEEYVVEFTGPDDALHPHNWLLWKKLSISAILTYSTSVVGGVAFTAGLFMFGWTGFKESIHWIAPTLSGLLVGFGILCIFLQCFNYLIDAYIEFAASVFAANCILRSAVGGCFPLFSRQMFNNLGVEWAGTLLGCLALIMIPIPFGFIKFGPKLRAMSRYAPKERPVLATEKTTIEV